MNTIVTILTVPTHVVVTMGTNYEQMDARAKVMILRNLGKLSFRENIQSHVYSVLLIIAFTLKIFDFNLCFLHIKMRLSWR